MCLFRRPRRKRHRRAHNEAVHAGIDEDAPFRVAEDRVLRELVLLAGVQVDPVEAAVRDHVSLTRTRPADRDAAAGLDLDSVERIAERDLARLVRADQVPLEYVILRTVLGADVSSPDTDLVPRDDIVLTVAFSTESRSSPIAPFPSAAVPAALVPIRLLAIV